jgi:general secretion pathway protein N
MIAGLRNRSAGERALAAGAAVAIAAIVLEMLWPHGLEAPSPRESAAPATADAATPLASPALRAALDYAEIGARPLFSADRKAYEPPAQGTVTEADAAPSAQFSLSGIVTTATARIALIKVGDSGQVVKLAVGEAHEGWSLVSADGQTATLRNGDSSVEIHLHEPSH